MQRKSLRLKNFDYSRNGLYFVTICVQSKREVFGEIVDGTMKLTEIGLLAKECWEKIPEHFSMAGVDQFVIMPHHMHGIISINDANVVNADLRSLRIKNDRTKMILSKIIHGYKSSVTRHVNRVLPNSLFRWQ